jgi:catechol 2,3-dioxygenase-like lactoylglutathione lyase family enzyme
VRTEISEHLIDVSAFAEDVVNERVTFPAPVPEIPVSDVDRAVAYYVGTLGFTLDWGDDEGGIAGISRGDCRLFVTNGAFRAGHGNIGPVLIWLNLQSRAEVDELFAEWKIAQANIVSEPEDKPWNLREFMVADADGNLIRVFYDFGSELFRGEL